jgi:hypothetical protein
MNCCVVFQNAYRVSIYIQGVDQAMTNKKIRLTQMVAAAG